MVNDFINNEWRCFIDEIHCISIYYNIISKVINMKIIIIEIIIQITYSK